MTIKSFLRYLEEDVQSSKRMNMVHLQDIKPGQFLSWLIKVKDEAKGIIKNYPISLKSDGLGARFGKDSGGRPFFEGSRTGPIFDSGSFSAYARSKDALNDESIARSKHYDDMLEIIKSGSFMRAVPADTKVICEIFYNPMAKEYPESGEISFVTVKYDKSKLGSLMTIIPFSVVVASSGEPHPDSDKILHNLVKESGSEIKILSPALKMGSVDINAIVDTLKTLIDDRKNVEAIIASRKASDKPLKATILSIIQKAKDDLANYLLQHPEIEDKFMLGNNIEGLVVRVPDIGSVKVTTPEFKESKRKK